MSHEHGAYLGSIRCIDTLRGRCVIGDNDCWHLRSASGKPMPPKKRHCVWVFGSGCMTATRAAWMMHTGKPPPAGKVVSRRCESYDCVNPKHLRCWTKTEEGAHLSKSGKYRTVNRLIAAKVSGAKRSRVTAEQRKWIVESHQPLTECARVLGIATSWAGSIRSRHRMITKQEGTTA